MRYHYNVDGDTLATGDVSVTAGPGSLLDTIANPSEPFSAVFNYLPIGNAPLAVDRVEVNDGDAQRSNIESITIFFNQATNLAELIGNSTILDAVEVHGMSPISLDASRYQYDSVLNALTIDLTDDGFGGSQSTMLDDGRYQILMDTTLIKTPSGEGLTDDDLVDDAIRTFDFHRLMGDFDGDADVDILDRNWLFTGIGSAEADERYRFEFDLTENGIIDMLDYQLWLSQYGKRL